MALDRQEEEEEEEEARSVLVTHMGVAASHLAEDLHLHGWLAVGFENLPTDELSYHLRGCRLQLECRGLVGGGAKRKAGVSSCVRFVGFYRRWQSQHSPHSHTPPTTEATARLPQPDIHAGE